MSRTGTIVISTPNQLKSTVEKLVMKAETADSIAELLWNSPNFTISTTLAPNFSILQNIVKTYCAELNQYERIQEIVQNDLIAPTNRRSWFVHIKGTNRIILKNKSDLALDFASREYYIRHMHQVPVEYNPNKIMGIFVNDEGDKVFNNYRAPFWKEKVLKSGSSFPDAALPSEYDKFLTHLCNGDEASKQFVLDWIAISLQARNRTYLCTIGTQGVGKGVLAKIIAAMHGKYNSSNILFETISKQFNKPFADKTFIYLDEVSQISKEQSDKLKKQNDDEQEIELKGVDSEVVNNFNNIYISSNHLEALRLEHNDRRHSIINITEERLETKFTLSEIRRLYEDRALIEQFAYYSMNRKYNPSNINYAFKSEQALKILNASSFDWEKWFIDYFCKDFAGQVISVKSATDVTLSEFRKAQVNQRTLELLSKKYEGIFKIKRTDIYKDLSFDAGGFKVEEPKGADKRVYCVEILPLKEQRQYELISEQE